MKTIAEISLLRAELQRLRADGEVAFVPTMGNLHRGHLQLVREAQRNARHVVVSIFVNPMQFGPDEDLDSYPRTLEQDQRALQAEGVTVLFAPSVATMYPLPLERQTRVSVPQIADLFCGASRPGHFDGVATVVCKLFNMVQPDLAVFGKKDFQQLLVIQRMVRDLAMPMRILGVDTVREEDGLAMSSRNQYLTPEERAIAPLLHAVLADAADQVRAGERNYLSLAASLHARLNEQGFVTDYVDFADTQTLLPPDDSSAKVVILAAAYLGRARLIDNIEISLETSD